MYFSFSVKCLFHFFKFQLKEDFFPSNFYRCEVTVDGNRHLLFTSDIQLTLLKQAKRWYLDGTFKVVKEPFTSLSSEAVIVRNSFP